MNPGYVATATHDYRRHGTTTLFAALDVATGRLIARCEPHHRHEEYLSFLGEIDAAVPGALGVHIVCDNYATHEHPRVRAWLAARPRFHVHYTPTYSSWINQVERFFAIVTDKLLRRGSFASVGELTTRIERFVAAYNDDAKPFKWTATAEAILAKVGRVIEEDL